MKLNQLFCKHNYQVLHSINGYYSKTNWYKEVTYKCTKCGKMTIKTIKLGKRWWDNE